ncbi:hypothetical protein, partial [Massilia aquatica]|uniref:hypothetical protein n=1 Tax=Massilia aquatica TaxID=2609000 RepID=UPI001A7E71BD
LAKHGEAAFADADRMEGSSSSFDKFTSSPFGLHQFLPRRLLAVLALRRGVRLAMHPLLFAINDNNFCTLT